MGYTHCQSDSVAYLSQTGLTWVELSMTFKNRDLVEFDIGGGRVVRGRVIAMLNTSGIDNPLYFLYAIKLSKRLKGHPWDGLITPGSCLKLVGPLDELAAIPAKRKKKA